MNASERRRSAKDRATDQDDIDLTGDKVGSGTTRIRLPYRPRPLQQSSASPDAALQRDRLPPALRQERAVGQPPDPGGGALAAPAAALRLSRALLQAGEIGRLGLSQAFQQPIPGVRQHESELRVDLPNGARLSLLGADNPDALRGIYLDGVVLDEFGQMAPRVFSEIVRPALADREGLAIFIGTPKGRNGFYQLYERAKADRRWFTDALQGQRDRDPLRRRARRRARDDDAGRVCAGIRVQLPGRGRRRLLRGARRAGGGAGPHRRVPWDPRLPVAYGVGPRHRRRDGDLVLPAARPGDPARSTITNPPASGSTTTPRAAGEALCRMATHILPQDAQVRELGTGRSRIETLACLGIRARLAPRVRGSRTASTRCG